jgi:hypothetical protein
MTSFSFAGNATSYLRIPNTSDLNFGTGDFTIEWYQYQTDSNDYPRIFQIGSYETGTSIGVSIEGGSFIFWSNNSYVTADYLEPSQYKNVWVHFSICRASGTTRIFMNGTSIYSFNNSNDYNSSSDLVIANESVQRDYAAFGGYIYYFTWVKGVALRTSNFTVSTGYPALSSDYMLLLNTLSFAGTLGSTVDNQNVTTVANVPSAQVTPQPVVLRKPAFTNNAMVFYKPDSLASGGIGGVRNASAKARRT